MSLMLESVCTAISNLSITGVTIKDADEIAASWQSLPNVLYPNINEPGFVTGFSLEYVTVLRGASAPVNVHYTLNYRFLGTALGDSPIIGVAYGNVLDKFILIIAAIMGEASPYSGKVQMELGEVSIGAKADPVGNSYHGADFALNIVEQI